MSTYSKPKKNKKLCNPPPQGVNGALLSQNGNTEKVIIAR